MQVRNGQWEQIGSVLEFAKQAVCKAASSLYLEPPLHNYPLTPNPCSFSYSALQSSPLSQLKGLVFSQRKGKLTESTQMREK